MTVEWNDNEPKTDITTLVSFDEDRVTNELIIKYEEAVRRLTGVLKANGIKAEIVGCSCCGTFTFELTFPDGAKHSSDSFYFECDGLSYAYPVATHK